MLVPRNVEEKIRYLLRKFPSTEWSGVLFYTHEGTFEDNNLVITCKDIYPMDLGSSTFTEFSMNEEVAGYMAENIELFDAELGLIHSHHIMSTFFSGTDTATLREEGNERNCFVSLIVNNEGTYNAAITRKITSTSIVTIKNSNQKYEFFGNGNVEIETPEEKTSTVVKEVIQYFMLDVDVETVENTLSYLDDRFEVIKKRKVVKTTKDINGSYYSYNNYDYDDFWEMKDTTSKSKQLNLWDDKVMKDLEVPKKKKSDVNIKEAAIRMITCSLILNVDKFDVKQWITKHMDKMYKKIFHSQSMFDEWISFIVGFTIEIVTQDDYAQASMSKAAEALMEELLPYATLNKNIKEYIDELNTYIL